MRVTNMKGRTGKGVANQYIIHTDNATYFQSYNTTIAKKMFVRGENQITLQRGYWDNYSATTNKYLNQFLNTYGISEIREKVASGEYLVGNI